MLYVWSDTDTGNGYVIAVEASTVDEAMAAASLRLAQDEIGKELLPVIWTQEPEKWISVFWDRWSV